MPDDSQLIRVVQQLSFCRDMDAVMSVLRTAARELTGADGVTVVRRDGDFCFYAEENAIAPLWKGRRFPMQSCISGWCMLNRRQVAIPDIYQDPRIPHDAYRPTFVRSLAMVPIRSEDPIGAIGAYWSDSHEASSRELATLQALGDSAAMAIANVQLIEALREASNRRDQFLAMLAHELRNPLAPIRNALHLLRLGGDNGGMAVRVQELMERQVEHLARLVDDLLDVSRFIGGKPEIRRERLDLRRLVAQNVQDRRGVMAAAGLTLSIHVPDTLVWIIGDAVRISQAFGNILDNAAKFTPKGGSVAVRLAVDDARSQAVVSVRDTGVGIESALLPRIFDVFSQADRSLDRARGGLGLGLSVAKGFIDLHDGKLEAASEGIGCGAEFTIRLPLLLETPALSETAVSAKPASRRLRVLVVEDNRDSAESLRLLLEAFGHEVSVAHSGIEGVEVAWTTRPDVVICDIGLPGMDGFAVASALRHASDTAQARLIAVTGYGQEDYRRRASEAGFDVHLTKPVEPGQLLSYLH